MPNRGSIRVFVSYRRDDTAGYAGRLNDDLAEHLGPDQLFFDVEGIRAGSDFEALIRDEIERASVMLILIGPSWLAPNQAGGQRIEDPSDWVRLEIEAALATGKVLVPVLLGGARMPSRAELPPAIAALATRQAVSIDHATWRADVGSLIAELMRLHPGARLDARRPRLAAFATRVRRRRRQLTLIIASFAACAFAVAALAFLVSRPTIVERIAYSTTHPTDTGDSRCDVFLESRLVLQSPAGGDAVRVTADRDLWETQAAWSPDGARIAFLGIDQADQASLFVVNADGSGLRDVLSAPTQRVDTYADRWQGPSWSSDGARLLFTYGSGGPWIVGADGSGLRQAVQPPPGPPTPTPGANGEVPEVFSTELGRATWLPDGRIGVEVTEFAGDPKLDEPLTRIWIAAADGSGLSPLADLPADISLLRPTWATTGALAFYGKRASTPDDPTATYDLFVLDAASKEARRLPITTDNLDGIAWSPDGTTLAIGGSQLRTIGADGSNLTELQPPGPNGERACWPSWGRTTNALLPRPTQSAVQGATADLLPYHRGWLRAGTYETDVFTPQLRFSVGEGWVGLRNYPDALALGRPTPFGEIDVGRVKVVSSTPCLDSPTQLIGPGAEEFITFLLEHPYLTVSDPRPVNIGSRTGLTVDLTVSRRLTAADCPDAPVPFDPDLPLWQREYLFLVGEDTMWLRYRERVRIVSIDVQEGPAVTFVIESSPEDYEAFLPIAQGVLDSLSIPE